MMLSKASPFNISIITAQHTSCGVQIQQKRGVGEQNVRYYC